MAESSRAEIAAAWPIKVTSSHEPGCSFLKTRAGAAQPRGSARVRSAQPAPPYKSNIGFLSLRNLVDHEFVGDAAQRGALRQR